MPSKLYYVVRAAASSRFDGCSSAVITNRLDSSSNVRLRVLFTVIRRSMYG